MANSNGYIMCDEDDAFLVAALEAVEGGMANYVLDRVLTDMVDDVENTYKEIIEDLQMLNAGPSTSRNTVFNWADITEEENLHLSQLLDYENELNHHAEAIDVVANQHGEGRRKATTKPLFEVVAENQTMYEKFKMTGTYYTLKIADPDPKINPLVWLRRLLTEVIDYFKSNAKVEIHPKDMIGMQLVNGLLDSEPVYISLRHAGQLNADVILDHILVIFDSNKSFFLNGHLAILFDHIEMPRGGGNRVRKVLGETNTEFLEKKAAFIKYSNPKQLYKDDEYCLPYAIVLGKLFRDVEAGRDKKVNKALIVSYQNSIYKLRAAAEELCERGDVNIQALRGGCTLEEVKKFQAILPEYQIVIYMGFDVEGDKPYTDLTYYNVDNKINIMLLNNHYTAMRSLTACFATDFVCPDCHKRATAAYMHKNCIYTCPCCLTRPPCHFSSDVEIIDCGDCLRKFRGSRCFLNHTIPPSSGYSVCARIKNCAICRVRYYVDKSNEHFCNIFYCTTCEKYEAYGHQCHMPLYASKRDERNILFVFFDFETQQNTLLNVQEPNKFKHVPHLCVLQTACDTCRADDDLSRPCESCGEREYIYDNGEDSVVSLLNFVVDKANEREEDEDENTDCDDFFLSKGPTYKKYKYKKVICICHNMSGFDGMFLLSYIYKSERFDNPHVIMNGTRCIRLSLGPRLVFIDSLNYFHKPLSKLPELFGFHGSKGWYPHLFSIPENNNYKGPLPEKHFYSPNTMSVKGNKQFNEWYDEQPKDYVFDNKKELIKYCRQDVNILRKACLIFFKDFWEVNEIDPYLDGCTMPGACSSVFRSKFLQKDTIGIIPPQGYRYCDNQSKAAIKWISLVEITNDMTFEHAGRCREKLLPGIGRVDGFHEESNTVLEYFGCYYHMHESCFPIQYFGHNLKNRTIEYNDLPHPLDEFDERNQVMFMRREATEEKNASITAAGYNLVTMWDCEFRKYLRENPEINSLLKALPVVSEKPLKPRDAFYGGRTNANKLYFKADGITKLYYYDVCSLYPFIKKYKKMPVGHPKLHIGGDCDEVDWEKMDGLMKVTVLPPRGLDFPVLPYRLHNKLMFFLCHDCAKTLNKSQCDHSDDKRMFTGSWVIEEIRLAIKHNYKIIKIHEIWEYEVSEYDPVTKTGGLFADYVNTFLKIKTEASGYPKSCVTEEQKDKYIKDFYEREGVLLEKEKIIFNASKRELAKSQLNSFWGRFGLRPDLLRTVVVKRYDDLVVKILDPKIVADSIIPVNDETLLFNYREREEGRKPDNTVNVAIAAFTTAYARIELYKYLDMLGPERIWYHDTDSIVFSAKPGEIMPITGPFLGQMTDELEKHGPWTEILEFSSGGPKNYAYIAYSPITKEFYTVVKVKGITLNYETSKVINFDLIKKFVTEYVEKGKDNTVEIETNSIRRTNTADVYSERVKKTYRINYTKRQKTGVDYGTIPYGY